MGFLCLEIISLKQSKKFYVCCLGTDNLGTLKKVITTKQIKNDTVKT